MLKSKDLLGKNPEISRNHKISERWIINQPNWGTEVHSRQKLPRKQLCWGCREITRFLQEILPVKEFTAQARTTEENRTRVESGCTSNSTGGTVSDSIGEQPTEGEKITQVDSAVQATLLGIKTSGNHQVSA
jgi:hypothetical protein